MAANLFEAFELLGMVTAESQQQQCLAAVLDTFSAVYSRLSPHARGRADDLLLCLLAPLSEQALSHTLESAIVRLEDALRSHHAEEAMDALRRTREALQRRAARLRADGPKI